MRPVPVPLIFGSFLVAVNVIPPTSSYTYIRGDVPIETVAPCPGLYCGRTQINATHNSACSRCPRGWRVGNNTHSLCQRCEDTPHLYDAGFLSFHLVLVVVFHCVAIDHRRRAFNKEVIALHACALLEVAVAALCTLLVNEPVGSLSVTTCGARQLSDWYSFLHNPNPNYEETLRCTQEIVYPLYTMVFVFYALCLILMLLARPCLTSRFYQRRGKNAIFAALYFLPILAATHAVTGGLIYMAYPYIVFVLSVLSSASHFAFKLDQSPRALLSGSVKNARDFVILIGHWLLHAFGILAITQTVNAMSLGLLCLVPLPALFYVATSKFTDPVNFSNDF